MIRQLFLCLAVIALGGVLVVSCATPPAPPSATATVVPATAVSAAATTVPPTAASVAATTVPPTAVSVAATTVPPTAVSAAATTVPPTATRVPATTVPPTATSAPPTSVPPTATRAPATTVPAAPTSKPAASVATGKIDIDALLPGKGPVRDMMLGYCTNCHNIAPMALAHKTRDEWYYVFYVDHVNRSPIPKADYDAIFQYFVDNYPPDRKLPTLPPELLEDWTSY